MASTAYAMLSTRQPQSPPHPHLNSRPPRKASYAPTPLAKDQPTSTHLDSRPATRPNSPPINPPPHHHAPVAQRSSDTPKQARSRSPIQISPTHHPPLKLRPASLPAPAPTSKPSQVGRKKTKSGGLRAFFGGGRGQVPIIGMTSKEQNSGGLLGSDGMANVSGTSRGSSCQRDGGKRFEGTLKEGLKRSRRPREQTPELGRQDIRPAQSKADSGRTIPLPYQSHRGVSPARGLLHSQPTDLTDSSPGIVFPTTRQPSDERVMPLDPPDGASPEAVTRRSKPSLSGFLKTVKAGATTGVTKTNSASLAVKQDESATRDPDSTQKPSLDIRTSSRVAERPLSEEPRMTGRNQQERNGRKIHLPPGPTRAVAPSNSRSSATLPVAVASTSVSRVTSPSPQLSRTTSHLSAGSATDPARAKADEDHYTLRIACTFLVRTMLAQIRALRKSKGSTLAARRSSASRISVAASWYEAEDVQSRMESNLISMERMERAWGIEWMLRRTGSDAPIWAERTKRKELDSFKAGIEDGLVLCFLLARTEASKDIGGKPTLLNPQRNIDIFVFACRGLDIAEAGSLPKGYFSPLDNHKAYLVAKIVVALARLADPRVTPGTSATPESPRSEDESAISDQEVSSKDFGVTMTIPQSTPEKRSSSDEEAPVSFRAGPPEPAWALYKNLSDAHLPVPILNGGTISPYNRVSFTGDHRRDPTPSLFTGSSATPRTSTAFSDPHSPDQADFHLGRPVSPFAHRGSRSPRHVRPQAKRGISLGSADTATNRDSLIADVGLGLGPPRLRARPPSLTGQTKIYAPKQSMRRDSGISVFRDGDSGPNTPPGTPAMRRESMPTHRPAFSSRRSSQTTTPDRSRQRQSISIEVEGKASMSYTLGNLIGKGQFGEVYRAMGKLSGDFVAVKRIDVQGLAEKEVKDILNEVELLKGLSHPGIVKYHGMRRDDAVVDIVLEYVDGGSLLSTLKAFGQFSEQVAASYTARILDGLIYLHDEGVIHCDMKCANILITSKGNIKITDFGISLNNNAPRLDQLKNNVAGSPNWMAPEVIELKGPSAVSDIWASGCTVIEMLTGSPPYSDIETNMAVMFRIVEDDLPPLPPDISRQCESFLRDCFKRNVVHRPSARALFAHPWIQNHLILEPGNSRNVEASIPFIKRVSRDWHDGSPNMKPTASKRTSLNNFFTAQSSPPMHENERSSSASQNAGVKAEHSFVQIKFSAAIACRLCALPLRTDAVFCQECGLVCHGPCAQSRGDICDARIRGAIEAISRRETNFSQDTADGSVRSIGTTAKIRGFVQTQDPAFLSAEPLEPTSARNVQDEQRRLALIKLTGNATSSISENARSAAEGVAAGSPAKPKDIFTPLPGLLSTVRRAGRTRPTSDQTQTRKAGTNTRATLRPFSSAPLKPNEEEIPRAAGEGEAMKEESRDCIMM